MNAPHELRTRHLLLARIQPADLDDLARMYADSRVMATLGGVRPAAEVEQYLQRQITHWDQHGFGLWSLRDVRTGDFVGRGGLRYATVEGKSEIEVAYGLMAEYWGRGLATELARESVRVGFPELGFADLTCFTLPTNFGSRRVMEKAGFRYERDVIYADLPHVFFRLTAQQWKEQNRV
jgi:RimJ/RimL family protein N-acetyltransferase